VRLRVWWGHVCGLTPGSPQTPQYSDIRQAGHGGGDFLFVRRGGVKAETTTSETPKEVTTTSTQPSEKADMLFWQSIKGSTDKDDYDAYLEQFPGGIFARLARKKVEKLGKPKQVAKLTPDTELRPERQEAEIIGAFTSLKHGVEISSVSTGKYRSKNIVVNVKKDGLFKIKFKDNMINYFIYGRILDGIIKAEGKFYISGTHGFFSSVGHSFSIKKYISNSYLKHSFNSYENYTEIIPVTMFFQLVDAPSTGTTAASK